MPKVGSDIPDSSHDLSLSDGARTWYFNIDGDPPQLDEQPQTPSTVIVDQRGKDYGNWSPGHAHIQQFTWDGGRGQNDFHEDESKFFDSQMLWNFTPGHLHPVPQWRFGEGYGSTDNRLMGAIKAAVGTNVLWKPLTTVAYYSRSFAASASYTAAVGQLWVRKRGSPPGDLTFAIYSNSGGDPGTLVTNGSATIDKDDLSDEISTLVEFTGMAASLTSGTTYHVLVYNTSAGDDRNHFEFAYSDGGAAGNYRTSADGLAWSTENTVQLMFRTTATRIPGMWRTFYLEGALYMVGDRRDGTATSLYINGDRGIATAGGASTLTDSTKSWTTNVWAGARVRITKGTGKGQHRAISSNTSTVLTVSAAWDQNPSTDSEFIIYATEIYTVVSLTGDAVDKPVKTIAVFNDQAAFGYGASQAILRVRWDSSTPDHDGRDESGAAKSDFLVVDYDAVDGAVVWRAENDTVDASRSDVKAWATDLAWGTAIPCGDQSWEITGVRPYEGNIEVFKEDSIGYIANDRFRKLNIGLDTMAESTNGIASAVWNLFLYFNWAFSMEQLYSGNLDDVGPWLHAGLPADRRGHISHLTPTNAVMYGAINAGTDRTSSVLAWNRIGFGEIMRAWTSGLRAEQVTWQSCPGTQDRLWMSIGGELVVMEFPDEALNFLQDSDINYHHESVLVTSTINMNAANIKKLFKQLSLTTRNLDNQTYILAEYQIDDEIDGTVWHEIGEFKLSDYQELEVGEGNKRRIRMRLRFMTEDSDSPAVLRAWVLEAFARTPVKYQWTMRALSKGLTRDSGGELDVDPSDFIKWLKSMGKDASYLVMRSKWSELDNKAVLIEPPGVFRTFQNRLTKRKGVLLTLAIREA